METKKAWVDSKVKTSSMTVNSETTNSKVMVDLFLTVMMMIKTFGMKANLRMAICTVWAEEFLRTEQLRRALFRMVHIMPAMFEIIQK